MARCATFPVGQPFMFIHLHSEDSGSALTPEPVPNVFPKIAGGELAADFVGERIAGDFYDAMRVGPERVLFGLMDVAGRREDNREILNTAQQIFRTLGAELFAGTDINESVAMTELCIRLNRGLIESSKTVHSCPAFIACYHEKFGTLCYTNAGHTSGLLQDSTGVAELSSTGLPLGLFSHSTCESPTVGLEKGAAVVLVSRGVVECGMDHEKSAEEYGLERIKELLKGTAPGSAQALCVSVLKASAQFGSAAAACDDRTALAFVRTA
jgi:serine phosphatase RsbU (regulator of sigma subunit)